MAVPESAMRPPTNPGLDLFRLVKTTIDGAIQHPKRAAALVGAGVSIGFLYFSGQGVVIADQLRGALGLPEPEKGNPTQKFIGDRPTNLGSHATNDMLSVDGGGDSDQGPDAPAAETEVPKGTPLPLLPNTGGGGATETFTPTPTRTPTPRETLLAKATAAHWASVTRSVLTGESTSPFFTVTPNATKVAQVEPSATQIVDSTATVVADQSEPTQQTQSESENMINPHTYERQVGNVTQTVTIGLGPDMKGKYADLYVGKEGEVGKTEWVEKFLDGIMYGHYETRAFQQGQTPSPEGFAEYKIQYGDPSVDLSYQVVDTSKGFKNLKLVTVDPRQPTTMTLVDTTKGNGPIVYEPNGHSMSSYVTISNKGGLILRPIFMEDILSSGASPGDAATAAVMEAFKLTHITFDQFDLYSKLPEGEASYKLSKIIEADPTRNNKGFPANFRVLDDAIPRTVLTLKK